MKLAVMPNDTVAALPAWKTLLRASERKREAIIIAMGEGAKASLGAFDYLIRSSAPKA